MEICKDGIAPSAPGNLVITDSPYDADGNISLSWTAATDQPACSGVDHYNVYRSGDGVSFTLLAESKALGYNDFSSLPSGKYYYRVTAVDRTVVTPHEGPAVEGSTTVGQPPSVPSGGGVPSSGGGAPSSGGSSGFVSSEGSSYSPPAQEMGGSGQPTTEEQNGSGQPTEGEGTNGAEDATGGMPEGQSGQSGILPITPLFLGLTAFDWTAAIVAGVSIALFVGFLLKKKKKKK